MSESRRRPRPPRGGAAPARGPPAADRQLLGVERDRDRHGRRRRRGRAAPPRRARMLRLRGRRPVPADRHDRQGRGIPLAAQVRRRAGLAWRPGRQAGAVRQRPADGAVRRDDPLRQPDRAELPPGSLRPRGGRHARHRRLDPRGDGVRAQGGGRRCGDRAARARRRAAGAGVVGREPEHRDPRRPHADRLAILTLGLRHPPGLLHGNFVVAVLSDLFGIQARSGCFCAGLYLHRMYPIDDPWSAAMHEEVARGHLGAKLAFTRISFGYFASEAAFRYIVDAVHLVADEGWKLLPYHRFDPASGLWEHEQGGARFSGATAPESRARRTARGRAGDPRRARPGAAGRSAGHRGVRARPLVPAA
jgi:hypothetical protein